MGLKSVGSTGVGKTGRSVIRGRPEDCLHVSGKSCDRSIDDTVRSAEEMSLGRRKGINFV